MGARHRLTREQIVYALDRHHPPALEIDPGDEVVLETWDARTGTIRQDRDLLDHAHPLGTNPATGPIRVRGAEPGDVLAVDVLQIDLAESGFIAVKAGQGLLAHLAPEYATRIVPVHDGAAWFGDRLRLPLRPMVGVVGTTPAGQAVSTGDPGPHGGNMDNRLLTTGARVYLPVLVEGALLGLGDVHGVMGDGEISFLGLEICAEVTVRIDLVKQGGLPGFRSRALIETPESWVTTAEHLDMVQAARLAAEEMTALMQARLGLSFAEAYMLMSAVVDVQLCQCCQPGIFPVTTRAVISKAIMP
jgi:amidase